MTDLNKRVLESSYFSVLTYEIFKSMFSLETDAKIIYIDLNHTVSVLFRNENVNDERIVDQISPIVEDFIAKYLEKGTQLIFIYYTKSSIYHRSIYEGWCKERDERVDFNKSQFLKSLIVNIKKANSDIKNLKVINIHGAHASMYIQKMEGNSKIPAVVVSKDVVMHSIKSNNLSVFDGKKYYNLFDERREFPLGADDSIITPYLFKYYVTLCGDDRDEYYGYKGVGIRKSNRYISKHMVEIMGDLEHPYKEFMDKYSKLYDMNSMMDWYNDFIDKMKEKKNEQN